MHLIAPVTLGLAALLAAAPLSAVQPLSSEPRNAELGTSRGGSTAVSKFRGKPVILFFEDRDSPDLNKEFKDRLFQMGQERNLLDAAHVVAVANLEPFDFFPARDFALAAVRKEEARWGIPILIDWKGALSAAPWNLPEDTSSVTLLDSEGRVVYEHSGLLSKADQQRFLERLSSLLGVTL